MSLLVAMIDDEQWAVMKATGTSIASTPEDEMGMEHGNPVAFDAVERGVKCGLGVVSRIANVAR